MVRGRSRLPLCKLARHHLCWEEATKTEFEDWGCSTTEAKNRKVECEQRDFERKSVDDGDQDEDDWRQRRGQSMVGRCEAKQESDVFFEDGNDLEDDKEGLRRLDLGVVLLEAVHAREQWRHGVHGEVGGSNLLEDCCVKTGKMSPPTGSV